MAEYLGEKTPGGNTEVVKQVENIQRGKYLYIKVRERKYRGRKDREVKNRRKTPW